MKKIIHVDEFTKFCGFFTTETTVNNCYGCKHPDQEEQDIDDETGKPHGKCYSFSCPLAPLADLEDMKELDKYLYEQFKDEEYSPELSGADYLVVNFEPEI